MRKKYIKIILMCAVIVGVFGGIIAKKQISSSAAASTEKIYFRLHENVTTVLSEKIYTAQGMCITGDTAYIAILKRPMINNSEVQRIYIYKVENISSNNPKIIPPTDYISIGHANGIEYRNGDLYIAPSVEENFRGLYRVGMQQVGDKITYYIKKTYSIQNSSYYNVTNKTYAKTIAYYKTIGSIPYYIVGIGQSSDKRHIKYMVGYFKESTSKFIPTNNFYVKKSGSIDYLIDGAQDISCINVNGRCKLVSTLADNKPMTLSDGYWPQYTRNLAYITDVTYINRNSTKIPEKRIGINFRKYFKYEIEAMSFAYKDGKFVPYGLFNIWEINDKNSHCTRLYRYNYNLY